MYKIITAIFCSIMLFVISLIISLVPINNLGNIVVKQANIKNININNSEQKIWNFRLFGLKITTSSLDFTTEIEGIKVIAYGNNFTHKITNNEVSFETLTIIFFISNEDDITNNIEKILEKIKSKEFSIKAKNLFIKINLLNGKKYKKEDKIQKDNNDNGIVEEDYNTITNFLLTNVFLKKNSKSMFYKTNIAVDRINELSLLISGNRLDRKDYEINLEVNDENLECYVHDKQQGSSISCKISNFLSLLKSLGYKIEKQYYRNIFNKKIILEGENMHGGDIHRFEGRLYINKDVGNVGYSYNNDILSINFDKLNLDDLSNEEDGDNTEQHDNKQIYINQSNKNNIIERQVPKIHINDNSVNKVFLLFMSLARAIKLQLNIKANSLQINNVKANNILLSLNKNKNNNEINIVNFTGTIDEKDNFQVKESNEIGDNSIGDSAYNLFAGGRNLKDFCDFFNIQIINTTNEDYYYYSLKGKVRFYTNSIDIKDFKMFIDDKQIFDLNFNYIKDYLTDYDFIKTIIKIENISLEKYFNTEKMYSNLYKAFFDYQLVQEQDATIWKTLFKKHHQNKLDDNIATTFLLNNVSYGKNQINHFISETKDKNNYFDLNVIIDSEFATGSFKANLQTINNYENIDLYLNLKNINFLKMSMFWRDFEKETKITPTKAFFDNKEYNIPSFIGINGNININIDNLITKDYKIFNNIKGKLKISNGLIESNILSCDCFNGKVEGILNVSLQTIPEINLGITATNIKLKDIISSNKIYGNLSSQCIFKSNGFNPVNYVNKTKGQCKVIIQNFSISKFDLFNTSISLIKNGVQNNIDYQQKIANKDIIFPQAEGEAIIDNGNINGNLKFAKELVSGSLEYEYNYINNIINKTSGSFAMMVKKKQNNTPFAIYLPFACNGKINNPQCIVNWEQLNQILN